MTLFQNETFLFGIFLLNSITFYFQVTHSPSPSEKDIQFILHEVDDYLSPDVIVRRADVQSAWTGIRPLVKDPNAKDTQSLVRNHVIHVSDKSGLITIAGGKWTTYR